MQRALSSLLVTFLLLVPALAQKGKGKPAPESAKLNQLKQELAGELAAFADWCVKNKFPGTALKTAQQAAALDPDNKKAGDVVAKAGGEDSSDDAALKALARKRESSGKRIGPLFCALFLDGPANARKEYDAYIVRAFEWDPENTDKWVEANYKTAWGEKKFALVGAMLNAALPFQREDSKLAKGYPERAKILRECEAWQASQGPLLKQARGHTMQYYLSVPAGWSADRKWPVIVAVEGAGCNFAGMNGAYGGPKNTQWLVLTPCGFSNTNSLDGAEGKYPYRKEVIAEWDTKRIAFDEPGLLAALDDVRADWNGEEKFYMTGFSGGGILTWHFIFTHPEKLAGAAPASANFSGLRAEASKAPEREKLPIHVFQGEDDEYRKPDSISPLDRQWEAAKATLEQNGYMNWKYELVPKQGHSACRDEVLKFFASLRPAPQVAPGRNK